MRESGDGGQKVRIAVDAMGGDNAPEEVVKGAVQAARDLNIEIILAGPEAEVQREMDKLDTAGLSIRLVNASEIIVDGEGQKLSCSSRHCTRQYDPERNPQAHPAQQGTDA